MNDFTKPFNPAGTPDFEPKPIRLYRTKMDIEISTGDMAEGALKLLAVIWERRRKIQVLHTLPKRLGRKGRKALRARMIRAGHFHRPEGKGNVVVWKRVPIHLP